MARAITMSYCVVSVTIASYLDSIGIRVGLDYFVQNILEGPMNGSFEAVSALYRVHICIALLGLYVFMMVSHSNDMALGSVMVSTQYRGAGVREKGVMIFSNKRT